MLKKKADVLILNTQNNYFAKRAYGVNLEILKNITKPYVVYNP